MNDKKKNVIIFIMAILIWILIGVIVFLVISLKTRPQVQTEPTSEEQQPIIQQPTPSQADEVEGDLDYSFLKLENEEKNKIYSPLSIKYALKMLEEGANGNTKLQITNLTRNLNLTTYENIKDVLSLANSVFIRDTYKQWVKDEYKNLLVSKYNAELNYDAFQSAKNVNNWIENKTLGIIKNMLSDDLVQSPDSKMLLINALAIDMEWEEGFSGDTNEQDFTLVNGSKVGASMMHKKSSSEKVSYYKDDDVTAVTLNLKKYDNTQLEFTAIMPNENLKEYVSKFNQEELDKISKNSILASNTEAGVSISIPRFAFSYDLKLKEDLKKLGITDAFSRIADFTNMTNDSNGLYVSDALHKADIEFTEKGIKAAAVTVFAMRANGIILEQKQPIVIKFDKPFMFVIRDKSTGELWFTGTVYEPELWKDAPKV